MGNQLENALVNQQSSFVRWSDAKAVDIASIFPLVQTAIGTAMMISTAARLIFKDIWVVLYTGINSLNERKITAKNIGDDYQNAQAKIEELNKKKDPFEKQISEYEKKEGELSPLKEQLEQLQKDLTSTSEKRTPENEQDDKDFETTEKRIETLDQEFAKLKDNPSTKEPITLMNSLLEEKRKVQDKKEELFEKILYSDPYKTDLEEIQGDIATLTVKISLLEEHLGRNKDGHQRNTVKISSINNEIKMYEKIRDYEEAKATELKDLSDFFLGLRRATPILGSVLSIYRLTSKA